jgi:predicted permease
MFRHKRKGSDFGAEIEAHIQNESERLREQGLSEEEAQAAARRAFGNVMHAQERFYEADRWIWWDHLKQDVRFGLRMLGAAPGFTAVAVLTLALGIGANTAIFGIVNAVLLRPLPFPEPDHLVAIYTHNYVDGNTNFSYPNFLDWQRENRSFDFLAAYHPENFTLTGADQSERIPGEHVSAGFFDSLGVKPVLGRNFTVDEDRQRAAPVSLLSEGLWRSKFGSMPKILGQSMVLDGTAYTVVGVIPASFSFSGNGFVPGDVYIPIGQWTDRMMQNRQMTLDNYGVGRLKPGVTLQQARADMDGIALRLAEQYPDVNKGNGITLVPLRRDITGGVSTILYLLMGAVGFVLLIACVNIANLLLARSTVRMREFAVRSALGATRGRCVRQLLSESVLLSLAGGALGLLLAVWGTGGALSVLRQTLPRANEIGLDARVLLFTLGTSLFAGILFGLAPALRMPQGNLQGTLNEAGRGLSGTRHRLQNIFIVAEMALALVLLTGAGLMIRTLAKLHSVNPGFNPHNTLIFGLTLPPALAARPAAALHEHYRQITANLESLPGVEAASMVDVPVPMEGTEEVSFWREDQPKSPSVNDMPVAVDSGVEPDFLKVMQIPLKQGRFITQEDTKRVFSVVVIDEVLAQKYFPHENPIGKRINIADVNAQAQIVGVVGHVKHYGLAEREGDSVQAQLYYPCLGLEDIYIPSVARAVRFAVRTKGEPLGMVPAIRAMFEKMNSQQTIYGVVTLDRIVSDSVASQRFVMILLGIFAALAVVLASIGIYGVISYAVGQRTNEIGLRVTLGAQRADVLRLVLGDGAVMALLGVSIGTAAAFGLTHLLANMLYGISARDPVTFAIVAILLSAVALAASYIPARRAMRVDPMVALRHE